MKGMRYLIIFAIISFLAACTPMSIVQETGSDDAFGSVTLSIPRFAAGVMTGKEPRDAAASAYLAADEVYVEVLDADSNIVESDYVYAGVTVTLSPIPAGDGYTVNTVIYNTAGDDYPNPSVHGSSGTFSVLPGIATDVTVTNYPFNPVELTEGVASVLDYLATGGEKWYSFVAPSGSTAIDLTVDSGDLDLHVYGPDGIKITESMNGGLTTDSVTIATNPGDEYYIGVFGYSAGNYQVLFESVPPFTVNASYSGGVVVSSTAPLVFAIVNPLMFSLDIVDSNYYASRVVIFSGQSFTIDESEIAIQPTSGGYYVLVYHDVNNNNTTVPEPEPGERVGWYRLGDPGNLAYTEGPVGVTEVFPGDTVTFDYNPPATDPYEPDNISGDAGHIEVGDTQYRSIHQSGDEDWITFYAYAGATYVIETVNPGYGTPMDTVVELYTDPALVYVRLDDDGGEGTYSLIAEYTAPSTGYLYIKVRGFNATSSIGDYGLIVTEVVP
jgi:hypothetical protein